MRPGIDNNSGSYLFNPGVAGVGNVVLSDLPFTLTLNKVQMVYNVTDGIPLCNFADSSLKASVSGNTITFLDVDTSGMSSSDQLAIYLIEPTDRISLKDILDEIRQFFRASLSPQWVDKSANQVRAQVTGTLSTITTVTTCATVTNLVTFDTMQGAEFMRAQSKSAWSNLVRGRIS